MSEWQRLAQVRHVDAYRTGWFGVYDALKSAITRNPRITVPKIIQFSVWVKSDSDAEFNISGAQLEIGDKYEV